MRSKTPYEVWSVIRDINSWLFQFKAGGIVSIEIGGMNGIDPLLTAAVLALPVVDADLMGRAFPELQVWSNFGLNYFTGVAGEAISQSMAIQTILVRLLVYIY